MKIKLRTTEIAYEEAGSGIPLLFIHGFPFTRKMWTPQINGLADTARVIAVDLRGHGESGADIENLSMELFADDCMEFIDAASITGKVILCGLSMGGYISLAFCRKYAHRLAGLILTATRAEADSVEARANREKSISQVTEQGSAPLISGMLNRLFSPYSLTHRQPIVQQVEHMMGSVSNQTIIQDLRSLKDRPDSTPVIPSLKLPICIIHGEDDQIIPVSAAQNMVQAASDARLHILPQAGHMLNLEQPDLFNATIQQFLAEFSKG